MVCSAQQQERPQFGSVLAAAALAAAVSLGSVEAAQVGSLARSIPLFISYLPRFTCHASQLDDACLHLSRLRLRLDNCPISVPSLPFDLTLGEQADVSGLTKCSESKQFAKRQKNELKSLDKRLKLVRISRHSAPHSAPGSAWSASLLPTIRHRVVISHLLSKHVHRHAWKLCTSL